MKTSQRGIELIKKYEGCKLSAYLCPRGKWTIGYGHTRTAAQGLQITMQQAEELLVSDLAVAEAAVNKLAKTAKLNQNQFDALVSFAFNIGVGAFRRSTLYRLIEQGQSEEVIRAEYAKWKHINGKPSNGLIRRRAEEINLYYTV